MQRSARLTTLIFRSTLFSSSIAVSSRRLVFNQPPLYQHCRMIQNIIPRECVRYKSTRVNSGEKTAIPPRISGSGLEDMAYRYPKPASRSPRKSRVVEKASPTSDHPAKVIVAICSASILGIFFLIILSAAIYEYFFVMLFVAVACLIWA